jgi:hypothetical protein
MIVAETNSKGVSSHDQREREGKREKERTHTYSWRPPMNKFYQHYSSYIQWLSLAKLTPIGRTRSLVTHNNKGRFTLGVEAIKSWGRFNQNFSPNGPKFGLKWSF